MTTIEERALEFSRRAKNGGAPTVTCSPEHAEPFLAVLKEQGFSMGEDYVAKISNTEMRQVVECVFFSTVGFGLAGATLGAIAGGKKGAKVGAAVGAATGVLVGAAAVSIKLRAEERNGKLRLSVSELS